MDWEGLRSEFPLLTDVAYFNACSQGALSNRVQAAFEEYLRRWRVDGAPWMDWMEIVERSREAFARLIGADASTISIHGSLTASCTAFTGAVVASAPEGRRRILVDAQSFPTVAHTIRAHEPFGIEVFIVGDALKGADADEWSRHIDERTLMVTLSDVYFLTGRLCPVVEVCRMAREAGAFSFVDVFQNIGAAPVTAAAYGADAIGTGMLKYLLGTSGSAYLYVAPESADRLLSPAIGWLGQRAPFEMELSLDPAGSGRRFEGGTWSMPSIYAAAVTLPWLHQIGPAAIRERILGLLRYALDGAGRRGLRPLGPERAEEHGPIVSFRHPDPSAAVARLLEQGVMTTPRGGGVRLGIHFYNNEGDVDRALDALAAAG